MRSYGVSLKIIFSLLLWGWGAHASCPQMFHDLAMGARAPGIPENLSVVEHVHRFLPADGPHRIFEAGHMEDIVAKLVREGSGATLIIADEFSADKIILDRLRRIAAPRPLKNSPLALADMDWTMAASRLNINSEELRASFARISNGAGGQMQRQELEQKLLALARGSPDATKQIEAEFALGHIYVVKNGDDRFSYVENFRHMDQAAFQPYVNVVGAGGCNALDIARVTAKSSAGLALVPTLISTACISVNKGVLKKPVAGPDGRLIERKIAMKTETPSAVYIPMKTLMETEPRLLHRYSGSGIADVMGRASGYADYLYNQGVRSAPDMLREMDAELTNLDRAFRWLRKDYRGWNEADLKMLTDFSHEASLSVIKLGSERSIGSEHKFYNYIAETWSHETVSATHGEIVGMGTLISMQRIAEQAVREGMPPAQAFRYVNSIKDSFRRLGVPVTAAEFARLGLTRERTIEALTAVSNLQIGGKPYQSILGDIAKDKDWSVLERALGSFPQR